MGLNQKLYILCCSYFDKEKDKRITIPSELYLTREEADERFQFFNDLLYSNTNYIDIYLDIIVGNNK